MTSNEYSQQWFSTFARSIPPEQTVREVAFVQEVLGKPSLVLDVPCGAGRHAERLVALGHRVVGLDRESSGLRSKYGGPVYVIADMRHMPLRCSSVDAVICLWQSFGFFQPQANASILREWAATTRAGGQLILDIYNPAWVRQSLGERSYSRGGLEIRESRSIVGDRLLVEVRYPGGSADHFSWQLFTREALAELAASCGWDLQRSCSGFDHRTGADETAPRIQHVLQRVG